MGGIFQRLLTWWNTVDRSQKPIYIGGAVMLTVLIGAAMMMAGRPQMSMLFGGLSPADQGMVVEELGKLGIRAEADTAGNVHVPSNKVAEARMKLATAKKLPNSGNSGINILDGMGLTTSPTVEREKVRMALESDLSNSIKTMAGIASVRVHLTLSEDSPFMREVKPASASIILGEDTGGRMRPDQAEAIARLVQFSVSGLQPERIAISNDKGQLIYDGANAAAAGGMADKRLAVEIEEARRRERDLQQKLDAAFGVGNTVVSIPVLRLNFDKVNTLQIQRDPSRKPTVRESVTEQMDDAEQRQEGRTGSAANVTADAGGSGATDNRSYKGENTRETFVLNETESRIDRATGDLEAMSINVLVNNAKITDATPVNTYIQGYLGPLAANTENFQATVTPVTFDTTAASQQQAAAASAASADRMQQFMSMAPILALLFVGFMVVKAMGKAASRIAPVQAPTMEAALPGGGTLALQPASLTPDILGDPKVQSLPEVVRMQMSPEQVIEFQQTGELAESLRNLAASMNQQKQILIEQIPEKVHVPLEQLKAMADQKPEAVANLLKTWILEEGRK